MRRLFLLGLLVAIGVLTGAACDRTNPFEELLNPTPIPPTTDTYSGTVTRNGAATHDFTANAAGTVTLTLTALSDPEMTVGFFLGTWNGTACQVQIVNDRAKQGAVITGQTSSAGQLCVRIYDVGNITTPIDYEMQVVHP